MRKFKYTLGISLVMILCLFLPFSWAIYVAEAGFWLLVLQLLYVIGLVIVKQSHEGKIDPVLALVLYIVGVASLILYFIFR